MDRLSVAVIMGGKSEERDISLVTGKAILAGLDPARYDAFPVDSAGIGAASLEPAALALPARGSQDEKIVELVPFDSIVTGNGRRRPDVAFIALHGRFGEDGTVQGVLELLGLPYVGSGVLASALAMNKIMARKTFAAEGIPVPKAVCARRNDDVGVVADKCEAEIGYPLIVKPNEQGSTIGMEIARDRAQLIHAVGLAAEYDRDILIEQLVEGVEITAGVLGNEEPEVLPLVEIVPASGFYDYEAKYTPGATEKIVPARIPPDEYMLSQDYARRAHLILGCRGMSRADMIVTDDVIYMLEVNTIPGMTPTSLLPKAAQAAGMEFPDLLDRLIGFALEKP